MSTYDATTLNESINFLKNSTSYIVSDETYELTYKINKNIYLVPSNGVESGGGNEWDCSDFIPYNANALTSIVPQKDYISLCFYDEDKNFIPTLQKYSTNRNYGFSQLNNVKYFKFSYKTTEPTPPKVVLQKKDKYEGVVNKNLIKKEDLINGYFINQNDGGITILNGYSVTPYIDLKELNFYLLADVYQQYAFYDEFGYYLSNSLSANNAKSFTTPTNAKWIRLTIDNSTNNSLKLITDNNKFNESRTIHVKKIGGDFNTIQKAIDYANERNERHTIVVDSGEWQENLLCNVGIGHTIKGVSKNDTIIFNSATQNDILKVKAGYSFQDLTFDQRYGAYAIHPDYGGAGLIEFFNCKIKTTYGSAVGAGSAEGQILRFRNCEIHQKGYWNENAVFYWHNSTASSVNEQRLELFWCDIYSDNGAKVLRIDDANQLNGNSLGNNAKIAFVGNNFYSKGKAPNSNILVDLKANNTPSGNLVGCIKLDERSYGNNITILNFQ